MTTIRYTPALESRLRNVAALPVGAGCRYLLCVRGQGDELIAKSWCRKAPRTGGDVVVTFGR